MSAKRNKDELNALEQAAAEAEAKERAYLEDDGQVPEIPEEYEDSFSDILNSYDSYANAANLDKEDIEKEDDG